MKFKDYEPIKFEFFQTDMEKIMYQIDLLLKGVNDRGQWLRIKNDLQNKINIHKERGEWK